MSFLDFKTDRDLLKMSKTVKFKIKKRYSSDLMPSSGSCKDVNRSDHG